MTLIEQIESLFLHRGRQACEGQLHEPASALEHALGAQLAEWDEADAALVAAALLLQSLQPPRIEIASFSVA